MYNGKTGSSGLKILTNYFSYSKSFTFTFSPTHHLGVSLSVTIMEVTPFVATLLIALMVIFEHVG